MELDMKERLNLVRKRKGLNQEEFGKRIGVTRSAVCNYENGTRPISDQVILAVCREFGIAESWLRYGSGTMEVPKDDDALGKVIDDYHCNKFEGEFLKTYFQMTEAERAEFVTAMYRLIRDGIHLHSEYSSRLQKGYFGVKVLFVNKKRTKPESRKLPNACLPF